MELCQCDRWVEGLHLDTELAGVFILQLLHMASHTIPQTQSHTTRASANSVTRSTQRSLSAHKNDGRLVRSQRVQGGAATAEMQSGPSSNAQPAASSAGQSQRLPANSGAQVIIDILVVFIVC